MKKIYVLFLCIFILASFACASSVVKGGEILYFANNKLLLNSGEIVNIETGAVIRVNNKAQGKPEIKTGQMAYAKLNPHTFEAVSIDIYDNSIKEKTRLDNLYINVIYLNDKKPLRRNEYLNITLKGTPKMKAYANIMGINSRVPLKETSNGTYRGSVKILAGYDISNATVIASLKNKNVGAGLAPALNGADEVSAVYSGFSIAATSPVIIEISPVSGSSFSIKDPNIFILYKSASALINTLRCALYVNGREVSCLKSSDMMFYEPKSLPNGRNSVKAVITDTAGNTTYSSWNFWVRQ